MTSDSFCVFCITRLNEGSSTCPRCGKNQIDGSVNMPPVKKKGILVWVLVVLDALLMLGIIASSIKINMVALSPTPQPKCIQCELLRPGGIESGGFNLPPATPATEGYESYLQANPQVRLQQQLQLQLQQLQLQQRIGALVLMVLAAVIVAAWLRWGRRWRNKTGSASTHRQHRIGKTN